MQLKKVSYDQPKGLTKFLHDFSKGENSVRGPNIDDPNFNVDSYLKKLIDMESSENLKPGYVPMSTYWLINNDDYVVGISKLRHKLNESLLNRGGNIGYYIKKSERAKGYGTILLKNTLIEAKKLG